MKIIQKSDTLASSLLDARGNITAVSLPQRRTIFFDENRGSLFLSFPSLVFRVKFYTDGENKKVFLSLAVGAMPTADCDQKTPVYGPVAPNSDSSFLFCMGFPGKVTADTPEELLQRIVSDFWSSAFSSSSDWPWQLLENLKNWASRTKQNPDWVFPAQSFLNVRTLKEFLEW